MGIRAERCRLLRNGIYYFRVSVPLALRARIGCAEYKKSLDTSDRAAASYVCRALVNDAKVLFIAMTKLIPTEHDLRQLMRDYFEAKIADAFGEYHEAFGMLYAPGTHPGMGLDTYGFIAAAQGELMRLKSLSAKHEFTDVLIADCWPMELTYTRPRRRIC